jgi:hypothetical protein
MEVPEQQEPLEAQTLVVVEAEVVRTPSRQDLVLPEALAL